MSKIQQRIGEKENSSIKQILEQRLEKVFNYHRQDRTIEEILSDLALTFIDILNLYEY